MDNKEAAAPCAARPQHSTPDAPAPITEYEFRLIRDHIHDYCGLFFDDQKIDLLASRLAFRLKLLDMGTFSEYYNYLRHNPRSGEEMDDLLPHLTNNETYFFREMNQMSVLMSDVIGSIRQAKAAQGDRSLRIVSCGCSSGEEAYTIAILLEEGGYYSQGLNIQITGIDIDRKVLEKAGRGVYTSYSLRATDKARIDKYFRNDDGKYHLDGGIRERVRFIRGNMMDRGTLAQLRGADVIFCRNVLIYFSDRAMRAIAETFYETLAPHGYLFLGHSESLTRVTDIFVPKRYPNAIIYCKKGGR